MALEPCRSFNTGTCSGTCLLSHEPDEHSFQAVPGGPNLCRKELLALVDLGGPCQATSGTCCYKHMSDEPQNPDTITRNMVKLLREERAKRIEVETPYTDITEVLKGIWGAESMRKATTEFISDEMAKTCVGLDEESMQRAIEETIGKFTEEAERTGEEVMELMKQFLIAEDEELSEEYFLEAYHFPTMLEMSPEFDMEEEMVGDEEDDEWEDEDDGESLDFEGHSGFNDDDVMELMSQGVMPWDDDAADVLRVLSEF